MSKLKCLVISCINIVVMLHAYTIPFLSKICSFVEAHIAVIMSHVYITTIGVMHDAYSRVVNVLCHEKIEGKLSRGVSGSMHAGLMPRLHQRNLLRATSNLLRAT